MVAVEESQVSGRCFRARRRMGSLGQGTLPFLLSLLGFVSCGGREQRYVFSDDGGAGGAGGAGGRAAAAGGTGGSILAPPGGSVPKVTLGTACPVNGSK